MAGGSGEATVFGEGPIEFRCVEPLFRATGVFRVGDEKMAFTATGFRVHRKGVRKTTDFRGHCWQSPVFPSGRTPARHNLFFHQGSAEYSSDDESAYGMVERSLPADKVVRA